MPDTGGNGTASSPPPQQPYPQDNDNEIRKWANLPMIGDQDAINTLNTIQNDLFGNASAVYTLAQNWLNYTGMNDQYQSIQAATTNLTGNWQGPAFEQYNNFVNGGGGVLSVLKNNQSAMQNVGSILANCVSQVYTTYQNAISAMGTCAGALAALDTDLALLAVPGVDVIAAVDVVNTATSALSTFVSSVSNLIAQAVGQIGQYKQNGLLFGGAANLFSPVAAPGSLMGDPSDWQKEKKPGN